MAKKKAAAKARTQAPKQASAADLKTFLKLFWSARKEHASARKNASADGPAHQAAVEFARTKGIVDGAALLEASLRTVRSELPQAESACSSIKSPQLSGVTMFVEASIAHSKEDYDTAIATYRQLLTHPQFEKLGMAWNNLGIALAAKKDYDGATEAYRKALADPGYDTRGNAWFGLARVHEEQYQPELAADAYEKCLAADVTDPAGHAIAEMRFTLLKSKLKPAEMTPEDRAAIEPAKVDEQDTLEAKIIGKIQLAGEDQYQKYMKQPASKRDDTFSILRGWSSAVTLLDGSEHQWRGGGYFLKWRGHGMVIDPGFDFLRNFHDADFHALEIQAVVVSHNHPDHNANLIEVDDIRYEVNKRAAAVPDDARATIPYTLIWDQDSSRAVKFSIDKPRHRSTPLTFDKGRCEFRLDRIDLPDLPFRLHSFSVQHGDEVSNAMGFIVELLDKEDAVVLRIGYTGDTRFFAELPQRLADCHILIAHMSQPDIEELKDETKRKRVHLGYRGTIDLIRQAKAKMSLIGEFWAGLTDLRVDLTKGVLKHCPGQVVLPTGIGMHIKLPSMEVECTSCSRPIGYEKVRVAPPAVQFGNLAYLCEDCFLG